jgi:hypothetical protein
MVTVVLVVFMDIVVVMVFMAVIVVVMAISLTTLSLFPTLLHRLLG